MNWLVLALLGLILTLLALINFWLSRESERWHELSDKVTLREALVIWEPIVLRHERTLRGVKRFANRARFLATDEPDAEILLLVGFVALDEIGFIDSNTNQFEDETEFRRWKSEKSQELDATDADWTLVAEQWLKILTLKMWNRYRTLATLGRSHGGE